MTALRTSVAALLCLVAAAAAWPASAPAATQSLDVRVSVRTLPGGGATLLQQGTFSGAPLGRGDVRVRTAVGQGRGSVVSFVLSNRRGTVRGTGDVAVTFKGTLILYAGNARITGGTGAYSGMHGDGLRVTGQGELSGEQFFVHLAGRVSS
jgi:hypothetical protein